MSKRCTFIALSNQKGGVGKSTMTVLLASYFHYVKGKNIAVIDCDYPQFSIQALRSRDMKNVERSEFLQQLLCRQYERTGKKAYPVLTSGPGKVLETADRLSGNSDILFFDLPGTVNTPRPSSTWTMCLRRSCRTGWSCRAACLSWRRSGISSGNILKHR